MMTEKRYSIHGDKMRDRSSKSLRRVASLTPAKE